MTSFSLRRLYGHRLGQHGGHFSAFTMAYGSFGGVKEADYIAVLAMDGQLQVIEQERPSFVRQLPGVLLPGPLLYVPATDCLVTTTAAYGVAAFRYSTLAAAEAAAPGASKPSASKGGDAASDSPLAPAWLVNVGAPVHALYLGRFSRNLAPSQVDILALAPSAVYAIREAGHGNSPDTASLVGTPRDDSAGAPSAPFRFQRRLDFYPAVAAVVSRPPASGLVNSSDNFLLVSATSPAQMRVYKEGAVQWAAQLQGMPVDVAVGAFGGVKGLIVSMDARGAIMLSFLGTDPPSQGIAALTGSGKQLDYAAMDAEHKSLLQTIREAQSEHRAAPKERLLMRVQPARDATFSAAGDSSHGQGAIGSAMASVNLHMTHTGEEELHDVTLSLSLPSGIGSAQSSLVLPRVPGSASSKAGTEPLTVPLTFMHAGQGVPQSLAVTAVASFMTSSGEPRTASVVFTLPLALVAVPILPVRGGDFNLTLDIEGPAPFLPSLWEDLLSQSHVDESVPQALTAANGMVFSLRYMCGADATVVAAKSGGRMKIYSNTLEALALFLGQLLHRINTSASSKGCRVAYSQPLPLADVFVAVDAHFDARMQLRKASSQLNDTAAQFRVIQKRLLARFKDRNPAPLNRLDDLLEATHKKIVELADSYAAAQAAVAAASNKLGCMITLLHLLMRLQFDLDEGACEALTAHLPASITNSDEPSGIHALDQGWEERAAAGVTHLLRTTLAKNSREAAAPMPPMSMPSDTSKLKRHVSIMCERLSKGAKLV